MHNHEQVTDEFKAQIVKNYEKKIKFKINIHRVKALRKLKEHVNGGRPKLCKVVMSYDENGVAQVPGF